MIGTFLVNYSVVKDQKWRNFCHVAQLSSLLNDAELQAINRLISRLINLSSIVVCRREGNSKSESFKEVHNEKFCCTSNQFPVISHANFTTT